MTAAGAQVVDPLRDPQRRLDDPLLASLADRSHVLAGATAFGSTRVVWRTAIVLL